MSFIEVLKGVGPKIAAGVKNIPATVAGWSQTTQIIAAGCTAGSLMVASVGGVAIYQRNSLAKETVEVVTETETETQTQTVVVQEETESPDVQMTEFVDIPTFVSCKISSDSLEKDLTLYIKGENNSKISGEAFQVKLINPNDKKKLSDAIDAIEDINEKIENASEEAASGNLHADEEEGSENAAADEGAGMLIRGDAGAASEDVVYVSSLTGLEISEKEALLVEKEKALKDYCDALASVSGESYIDDNSDGMIYISKINSGDYLACLVPTNDYIPNSLTVKVNVKDKLEYKAVETIEDKTVSEAAAGDVKETHEEIEVENVLADTVEWVDSSVIEGNAKFTAAPPKFADAAVVTKEAVVRLKKNTVEQCTCELKCTEADKNSDCPVCKNDITKCTGKACTCEYECTSAEDAAKCAYCKESDNWKKCPCTKEKPAESSTESTTESSTESTTEPSTEATTEPATEKSTEEPGGSEQEDTQQGTETSTESGTQTSARIVSHYSPRLATSSTTPAEEYTTGKLTLSVSATTIYNTADGTRGSAEVKVTAPEGITPVLKVNGTAVTGSSVTIKASDYRSGTVSVIAVASEPKDKSIDTPKDVTTETIQISVVSAETALKDAAGNALFKDDQGKAAATVGDYKTGVTFYNKTGEGTKTYYGWQTIDGVRYYFDKNGKKVTGEQVILGNKYNFGSDGALLTSGYGIDVSKWQGDIDWSQAKSAVSFAIIRAGIRGTTGALSIDSYAGTNIKNAKANGVKVGLYFYSRAQNEVQAVEEASLAVSIANQYGGISLPIYIDMEDSSQAGLSTAQRDAIALAFCQTVKNAGYSAGVYANKTWLTNYLTPSKYTGYSIWCAQYNTTCTYTGRYDIWQYSSKGSIPGIKGNVDLNQSFF